MLLCGKNRGIGDARKDVDANRVEKFILLSCDFMTCVELSSSRPTAQHWRDKLFYLKLRDCMVNQGFIEELTSRTSGACGHNASCHMFLSSRYSHT